MWKQITNAKEEDYFISKLYDHYSQKSTHSWEVDSPGEIEAELFFGE